jgi:type VI secretion system protein ImpH
MGASSGASHTDIGTTTVREQLRDESYRFEFFQAVRLLERLFPGQAPVGTFVPPAQEVVRFQAGTGLVFPASEIQALALAEKGPALMKVNFMGLTGPEGVLPLCYTSLLVERGQARDTAPSDFLNIFNHRMISLFYQAWQKYRFAIAYERGGRDRFSRYLLALIGLGTPGLSDRLEVRDDSLLYYAGLLAQRPRSAVALEQLLSDYFEVPVEVEQFAGGWYPLDANTQTQIGSGSGYSEQLGVGAVVGNEVWDQTARVRIRIGPLSLAEYKDFLPAGSAFGPLQALTRFFASEEFDFEIRLILKRQEVPRCELGAEGEGAPRLGWVTWAKTKEMAVDRADTILQLWEGGSNGTQPESADRKAERIRAQGP